MSDELRKKLITIINSNEKIESLPLTLDEKEIILTSTDYLAYSFLEACQEKGIRLCDEEETKKLIEKNEKMFDITTRSRLKLFDITTQSHLELVEYPADYILKKFDKYNLKTFFYLRQLKDEKFLLDFVANINPFLSDKAIQQFVPSLPDETIEKMILDPRNNDEEKLVNLAMCFKEDKYITKYIHTMPKDKRFYLIKKINDDNVKKKYISLTSPEKGEIISSLKSDEEKIKYLKKYSLILSSDTKAEICLSLKDKNLRRDFVKTVRSQNELMEITMLCYKHDIEFFNNILLSINGEKNIEKMLDFVNIFTMDFDVATQIIDKINSQKLLDDIFAFSTNQIKRVIAPRVSEKALEKYVEDHVETNLPIDILMYVKNDDLLKRIMLTTEITDKYTDKYLPLFEKISKAYNLNLNNLVRLAKVANCGILNQLDNENVKNTINLSEEDFVKYLNIFSEKNQNISIVKINSVLTPILNKKFELEHPNELYIYLNTISNIENKEYDEAILKIKEVCSIASLEKKGISIDQLVNGLFQNDKNMKDLYKILTQEYLKAKKDNYLSENISEAMGLSSHAEFNKSAMIKYFINASTTQSILNNIIIERNRFASEYKLLNNEELLREIIEFKKGNISYQAASQEVKESIKLFEDVFYKIMGEKILGRWEQATPEFKNQFKGYLDYLEKCYPGLPIEKVPVKDEKNISILEIMANINPNKLKDTVFASENLYQELLKYIESYGLIGWNNCFEKLSDMIDVELTAETVGVFINNYSAIVNKRKINEETQEPEIDFIEEMAFAECLGSKSNIYKYLFGEEDYRFLHSNPLPFSGSLTKTQRFTRAVSLLKKMKERKKIAVPPVDKNVELESGKEINLSIGETNNPINLTLGERTGACMRIGGAADNLFEFCLLNENGFHAIPRDPETNELISRASGWINGNTAFFNLGRMPINRKYSNDDVKNAFKLLAEELIEMTKDSPYPIENVIVAGGEVFSDEKTERLGISDCRKGLPKFRIDYDTTEDGKELVGVVLATSNKGRLVPIKQDPNSVEKYDVSRMKVKKVNGIKSEIATGRIEALDQLYSGVPIDEIEVKEKEGISYSYVGEDWYIIVKEDNSIVKYIQENTSDRNKAIEEMNECISKIQREIRINSSNSDESLFIRDDIELLEVKDERTR